MRMQVMEILAVLVVVRERLMTMPVAVGPDGHRVVTVAVVLVVVAVYVLVLERFVPMAVSVLFREV